jgi:hypothetical protein
VALSRAWTRRAFDATGLSPLWVGIALALAGGLALSTQELLLGRFALVAADRLGDDLLDQIRVALTHIVITAYLVTACVVAERSAEASLSRLEPLLDLESARPRLQRSASERRVLLLAGPIGLAINLVFLTVGLSPGEVTLNPADWTPETAWHRVLSFFMGFWGLRLVAVLVIESGRLSDLAAFIRDLDLLDMSPLDAFTRQGLTHALLWIGSTAAFALFLVDLDYLPMFAVILIGTVPVAAVVLLWPLRGVHRRIIDAKHAELRWCRARLRTAREAFDAGDDRGRIDELVAWEARIAAVREWPLDASAYQRFGLYLLIPLGSWSGGALAERLIDALLG